MLRQRSWQEVRTRDAPTGGVYYGDRSAILALSTRCGTPFQIAVVACVLLPVVQSGRPEVKNESDSPLAHVLIVGAGTALRSVSEFCRLGPPSVINRLPVGLETLRCARRHAGQKSATHQAVSANQSLPTELGLTPLVKSKRAVDP
jgi:hypothetical protein